MRAIPPAAAAFVKSQEGLRRTTYADVGGVPTIGYGHAGPAVAMGQKISRAEADIFLVDDLATAARRLAAVVKDGIIQGLTENQYSALLSFVFNMGAASDWQIWTLLNAGRYDQIPAQLNRFVNAGGRKVQGLVNRRAAEVVLWSTAEPGSVSRTLSSATTRAMPTPPTPQPAPKAGLGAHVVGAVSLVGAGCTTYAPVAKDWADKLAAFTGAPIIQHVSVMLMTVAGMATLAGIVSAEVQRRTARR